MSQVVGSPFILEIMLRSGVPPHIGQSPPPGSEAETGTGLTQNSAQRTNASSMTTPVSRSILDLCNFIKIPRSGGRLERPPRLLVGRHLDIIKENFAARRVGENAGAAAPMGDRVNVFER